MTTKVTQREIDFDGEYPADVYHRANLRSHTVRLLRASMAAWDTQTPHYFVQVIGADSERPVFSTERRWRYDRVYEEFGEICEMVARLEIAFAIEFKPGVYV